MTTCGRFPHYWFLFFLENQPVKWGGGGGGGGGNLFSSVWTSSRTQKSRVNNYLTHQDGHMKTSSNGNIFRVTGHLCGNSPVTAHRRVTRSFDVFFDLRLNKKVEQTIVRLVNLGRHRSHYGIIVMIWCHWIYDATNMRPLSKILIVGLRMMYRCTNGPGVGLYLVGIKPLHDPILTHPHWVNITYIWEQNHK